MLFPVRVCFTYHNLFENRENLFLVWNILFRFAHYLADDEKSLCGAGSSVWSMNFNGFIGLNLDAVLLGKILTGFGK